MKKPNNKFLNLLFEAIKNRNEYGVDTKDKKSPFFKQFPKLNIESIFLKNPLLTGSRIRVLGAVIKSEDIENKYIENVIKQILKTKYSDAMKSIVMSTLIRLFGKNKIEELKNS